MRQFLEAEEIPAPGLVAALLWVVAIPLAAAGIWWYAVDPRDLTYWAATFALYPLGGLVLEAANRRLPYRLQWAIAIFLAPAGAIAYLLWMNEQWWFYGLACSLPLFLLAHQRAERLNAEQGQPPSTYADGPWGIP